MNLEEKYLILKKIINDFGSVVIGFSGGVDSTLLAKVAFEQLGNRSLAVIGVSPSYPNREKEESIKIATDIGIPFVIIDTNEMNIPEYRQNKGNRCYFCKKELYSKIEKVKEMYNFSYILDGTNYSDLKDIRPGFKATEELNIKKPLLDAMLTKEEIRQLSKKLLLPTWDKQEFACLSSRLPVGTQITLESLSQIEQGEQILYELGFKVFRLRYYQNIARIELSEDDMYKIIKKEYRQIIIKKLTQIGFKYITLDLVGYQKGNTSIANN